MQDRAQPLVHIGYQKTASTWLQKVLFVSRDLGFVSPFDQWEETTRALVYADALGLDVQECKALFSARLEQAKKENLIPVVTSERLSGAPQLGGHDCKEIADRLADVFPEGKVLIVIREQKSLILSCYKQYIRRGGVRSLPKYLNPPERYWSKGSPSFRLNYFEYHRLIGYYQAKFGKERVLVLPYEYFESCPQGFIDEILHFANGRDGLTKYQLPYSFKKNPSLSGVTIVLKRHLNQLTSGEFNPEGVLSMKLGNRLTRKMEKVATVLPNTLSESVEERLCLIVEQAVGDCFQTSNRHTEQLIGRGLGEFGYLV